MSEAIYPVAQSDFVVTGEFGNSPWYYAQFGQAGHNGVDIGVRSGTPVYAADDGEVVFEGRGADHYWMGAVAGICILIRHWWGYTGYAHLSLTRVNAGQWVGRGQRIADSGNTTGVAGGSTGDHLHFESLPLNPNFANGYAGRVNPTAAAAFIGFAGPGSKPLTAVPERTPMIPVKGTSAVIDSKAQSIPGDSRHHLLLRRAGKVTRKRNAFAVGPLEMTSRNVELRAIAKPGAVVTFSICRYNADGSETVLARVEPPVGPKGVIRTVIPVTERLDEGQGLYVRARGAADVTMYKYRGFKQR